MKIIDRYLAREFFIPLLYCLAAFFLVYIIYDLSAHLDTYIEHRLSLATLLRYYVIQLPLIFVWVIPLAILLAIIYCLSTLSRHNEITAMRASGVSIYRIMLPFFLLGIFFTLLIGFINENFAPRAYAESQRFIEETDPDREKAKEVRPFAFLNPRAKRTWEGQWIPGSDVLNEVSVRTLDGQGVTEKLNASEARYLDGEWWFFGGSIQNYDSHGRMRGPAVPFSKRRFSFEEKPGDFTISQKDSESMNSRELRRNMELFPKSSDTYRRKLVDANYKIAMPFVGITIVLIAVPLAIRTSRTGAAGSVGMSIVLCISYYVLSTMSITWGRGGGLSPWLAAWLPNIVFSGLGVVMIYKSR